MDRMAGMEWVLAVAIVLGLIGALWIRRVTEIEPTIPSPFRSRSRQRPARVALGMRDSAIQGNAIDEVDALFARSFERARRGRRLARMLFVMPWIVLGVAAFLFVSAPGTMGGGMHAPSPAWVPLLIAIPAVAIVIGLAWMWRILRSAEDPDLPRGPFRYRSPRG